VPSTSRYQIMRAPTAITTAMLSSRSFSRTFSKVASSIRLGMVVGQQPRPKDVDLAVQFLADPPAGPCMGVESAF
jgi:hypothetical protein